MENIAQNFWYKWEKSDEIERIELLKPLAKLFLDLDIIKEKNLRIHAITSLLNSYLEDLNKYI